MILHLRVAPGFGIAVEARSRPKLYSIPVVMMGGPPHSRGTVREASFPAQARGVQPGVTVAQAHQHCPDGLFLSPDDALYTAVWGELCAILRRYTPLVEPLAQGQALLDLSGCPGAGDLHSAVRLAGEIARAVRVGTGVIPWLGLAANRLVAELASREVRDGGITVAPAGQERAFLADLPLTTLPDVDARLALTFQVLGLRTIGQFAALPRNAVRQRFGALGERLHGWSRGIDSRPVVPPAEEPAVRVCGHCDEGTLEDAIATLHRLAGECAAELQRRSLTGTLIALTLTWSGSSGPSVLPSGEEPNGPVETPRLPLAPAQSAEQAFPIAYRIHSMLPQPSNSARNTGSGYGSVAPWPRNAEVAERSPRAAPSAVAPAEAVPFTTLTALVRTPITAMPALFERARDLLLRHWPQRETSGPPSRSSAPDPPARRLQALELAVSSFEQPVQLAFVELNRLDGIGVLRGLDPARRRALEQAEEALANRYGETSFRRLAHLDPANILTERRFRWGRALSPEP
jgi:nucleotidyltransferase/DNA polymerase involved in DNA repair